MVTLNRQSLTYTLCTSPLSLLFEPCQSLTNKVVVHFLSSNIESAYHVAGYLRHEFAIIAVMSLCRNITCESIPGSPLHIHLSMGRGESLRMRLTSSLQVSRIGECFCCYGNEKVNDTCFGLQHILYD